MSMVHPRRRAAVVATVLASLALTGTAFAATSSASASSGASSGAAHQSTAVPAVPVVSFAAAAIASGAHPAASPSGVNPASCTLTSAHPYPVVLVNGTFEVMQDSFDYLGPTIANAGYCVYGYNYGGNPAYPIQAVGPVEDGVTALTNEISVVRRETGASKVALVGYSQGGLISELYTKFGGASTVASDTLLAPTTHGTTLLGIGTLGADIPGALPLLSAAGCPACSDQVVGSAVVTKLDNGPIAVRGIPYTVIDTTMEDVVTPTGSSFINEPGVYNTYVQSHAALDIEDHITLPFDPVAGALVLGALKQSAAA